MTMPDNPYQRIVVLGSSGAGKSTLARVLGHSTGLPVVHLDQEHWQAGWSEPEPGQWAARLTALAAEPAWIIDGQYGTSLLERLARADLAVWLDLPTATCLWRVIRRTVLTHGRVRADMAPGCPERFNGEFLHYVATFRRYQRPWLATSLSASAAPVVHLMSRRAQYQFTAAVRRSGLAGAVASAALFPAPP